MRTILPIHSAASSFTGFLIRTNCGLTGAKLIASAKCCTAIGSAPVLAPIHIAVIPACSVCCSCSTVATSVAADSCVSCCACISHGSPFLPIPWKVSGEVRGFHIPARRRGMRPCFMPIVATACAVVCTCSADSAAQGPATNMNLLFINALVR